MTKLLTPVILGLITTVQAATSITFNNLDLANFANIRTMHQLNGTILPAGSGYAAVGGWDLDDADVSAGFTAGGLIGIRDMLRDFIQFGESAQMGIFDLDGVFEGPVGAGTTGFVDLQVGDPLDGRTIYTVVGDGPTLLGSTDAFVYRHTGTTFVAQQGPIAEAATVTLARADPANILYGTFDPNLSVDIAGTATQGGLKLGFIPEPSTSLLALLASAFFFLRRRR